jgi:hypothetical protein
VFDVVTKYIDGICGGCGNHCVLRQLPVIKNFGGLRSHPTWAASGRAELFGLGSGVWAVLEGEVAERCDQGVGDGPRVRTDRGGPWLSWWASPGFGPLPENRDAKDSEMPCARDPQCRRHRAAMRHRSPPARRSLE